MKTSRQSILDYFEDLIENGKSFVEILEEAKAHWKELLKETDTELSDLVQENLYALEMLAISEGYFMK